ncbi:hypothetical protein Pcinc_023875 [Petrolisthes cinctipes]|uniref:Uncharacterized protein n=1 Tax=Petrolisthes cinctipes TaxID=88211 RepID=A0AAE1KG52_PETCI|nr:hypothetical protein Pcinc_023875 [Petrolisthes cinctipes]
MPNAINTTAIQNATPGGQATSVAALAFNIATGLFAIATLGKRRKRHDHHDHYSYDQGYDHMLQESLFKVLSDLDEPSCLALGLCYAIGVPQHLATTVHTSLITMLSPETPAPFPWPEVNKAVTKYQYAALVGQWARMTEDKSMCQRVFPSCTLTPTQVIKSLSDMKISCHKGPDYN